LDMMVKGRMAGPGRVEDGAFKLTAPQGLAPLRAFGVTPPRALAKMQDLTAEGTASGTLDALAVDAKAESGGLAVTARGTLAALMAQPRADLAVAARAASLGQAIRALGGSHPQGGGPVALDARLTGDQRALDIGGLSLRLANTSVTGQGHVDLSGARPSVTADLSADSLNLDTLLGAQRTGVLLPGGPLLPPTLIPAPQAVQPVAAVGAGASPFSREPLELSALNAFDARLSLRAQTVSAGKWRLDTMAAQAAVQGGTATVERLTGKLLGGDLSASLKLSAAATPALSGQIVVSGADLGAAKLAGAGLAVTEGRMDAEARFSTTGRSSQDMAARLDGDGKLLVRNGILEGFDLPAVNQQMTNLRNIGSLLGLVQAGLSGGRTPFSQLAGTFRADNGIVTSRDLRLDAAGGGAGADALVNLPEWSTRTNIAFHLANAPQTPLGVRLEGPLENPRKVVDVNAIQQYMVSKGLGRALKGMGGDQTDQQQADQPREKNTGKNILKNLLKGLGGQ
ncbi:MAG TPA: AsmA family protein, partial [Magnetospirillum sp.]|nr:AsmA family protein [Magnetospirillum sp.]